MKSFLLKIKAFLLKLVYRFIPSKIPTGVEELEKFSKDIIDLYKFPDFPSYHHAIATMIMHLGPLQNTVTRHYVARGIQKSMANQVAYQVIQNIKQKEKETKDAEQSHAETVEV
jgi:CRISPR/Cas system CMR-associated protein Cmr5 small subunit